MSTDHEAEVARAAREYERRDRVGTGDRYALWNTAHLQFVQQLELQYARQLNAAGFAWADAGVLDVGCGTGGNLQRLKEFGVARAVGLDLMEPRIAKARAAYPTLEFHVGSATELPFDDGTFDLVTQFVCLSSILDPGVRAHVIREMFRVARPGGLVMSFDMGPPMRALSLARRLRGLDSGGASATPTVGIGLAELTAAAQGPLVSAERPTLHPEILQVVARRPLIVSALRAFAPLRSHLVALFRKEAS